MATEGIEWDDGVGIAISLMAGVLFFIALRAYLRTRTPRVLLFASAFGVVFLKAVVVVAAALWEIDETLVDTLELTADASMLILFFLGMTRS